VPKEGLQAPACAEQLKALGDPLRLRIIDALRQGELTVSDLAELLQTELVLISHHLQVLKHARLVQVRREGRYMYYSLPHDLLQQGLVQGTQVLNLGCCRLEVPPGKPRPVDKPPAK